MPTDDVGEENVGRAVFPAANVGVNHFTCHFSLKFNKRIKKKNR